jgi:ATP-dependent protease HslVU (ClpYQ) ATPase subunit
MEYLLEDISFNAGGNDYPIVTVEINAKYVEEHLADMNEGRGGKRRVAVGFGQANTELKSDN